MEDLVFECEDRGSSPYSSTLPVFVNFQTLSTIHRPSIYQQLVDTTMGFINSWLISKNPYQQSIGDKELIVDNVVLINKDPYPLR